MRSENFRNDWFNTPRARSQLTMRRAVRIEDSYGSGEHLLWKFLKEGLFLKSASHRVVKLPVSYGRSRLRWPNVSRSNASAVKARHGEAHDAVHKLQTLSKPEFAQWIGLPSADVINSAARNIAKLNVDVADRNRHHHHRESVER